MNINHKLVELYNNYRGEFIGSLIGLVSAICFLWLGVFKTLFVLACIIIGYHTGKMISIDKNYIRHLLEKILPPGTYR